MINPRMSERPSPSNISKKLMRAEKFELHSSDLLHGFGVIALAFFGLISFELGTNQDVTPILTLQESANVSLYICGLCSVVALWKVQNLRKIIDLESQQAQNSASPQE